MAFIEEVNAAIKRFIDPNKMVTVLAGTLPSAEPIKKPEKE